MFKLDKGMLSLKLSSMDLPPPLNTPRRSNKTEIEKEIYRI